MSNHRHGYRRTKLYGVWRSMISRCTNPNVPAFHDYGARGITVCERWKSFPNFLADMGEPSPGQTLERKDNDKGYSPENCAWASRVEQARNKRGLRLVTARGVTRSVGEWAEITGLAVKTISARLSRGWSEEAAVTQPKVADRRTPFGAKHSVQWSEPQSQVA